MAAWRILFPVTLLTTLWLARYPVLCQSVQTRILPSDHVVLEGDGQNRRSRATAIIWCLTQDLYPKLHKVQSIELYFKPLSQMGTGLSLNGKSQFEGSFSQFEDSFSQFGLTAGDSSWTMAGKGGNQQGVEYGAAPDTAVSKVEVRMAAEMIEMWYRDVLAPSTCDCDTSVVGTTVRTANGCRVDLNTGFNREMDSERDLKCYKPFQGFPEAGSTGLVKNSNLETLSGNSASEKGGLLPGSIAVAKVSVFASATLGVRHVQRSGVSVRGVISTSNPNLSSLQVTMRRASCRDCGTYMCIMRYHDDSGNFNQTHSTGTFVVAQSTIRRLNMKIVKPSLNPDTWDQEARKDVDLFCFGTVSTPTTTFLWTQQAVESRESNTSRAQPEMTKQGQPRLGRHCQYWRASRLRHSWKGIGETWLIGCFLSRDRNLMASAMLSQAGPLVVAQCGDPNSTTPTKQNDNVSVICDVKRSNDISSVTWYHWGLSVGECMRVSKDFSSEPWQCVTSEPGYSLRRGVAFVLTIARYDVTRDKGQWGCSVTPLLSAVAAACVLG